MKVGFIWTDLIADPQTKKLIKNRDHLLLSEEYIKIAKMQNKYPSFCKQSTSGICGSKFVSILVTGF